MTAVNTTLVLKALADDTRLSIVRKLAEQKCPTNSCDLVQSCASFLQLSQPAMSHHFSKLVDAGVVIESKKGTQKIYELNDDVLRSIGIDATKL